ncbi:SH3 domain-containing protein [Prosthecobacter sp.]|uniref:SH3 domain-containing protein n=1 Tax=Prosthecobacter sp. TaxID=1965333 RepID=UPI00378312FC
MASTSNQNREQKQHPIVGIIVLLLLAMAVFLLMPGMALIAFFADTLALRLDPVQMWAFSIVISLCVFVVLRILAPDTSVAGWRYLILCGTLAVLFILFFFGLKAPFSKRWVVLFIPAGEPSSHRNTTGTTDSQAVSVNTTPADTRVEIPRALPVETPDEIPRALPVSDSSPPLKPLLSSFPAQETRPVFYSVTGVGIGDTLNVRNGPGVSNTISARLPNGFNGIRIIGPPMMNGTTEWVQIEFEGGYGWVTKQYLQAE